MKPVINNLYVGAFRGIKNLRIDDLSVVNIFAGTNNSGKTSLLEVIGLLSQPDERQNIQKWALMRTVEGSIKKNGMEKYLPNVFPVNGSGIDPIKMEAEIRGQHYQVTYSGIAGNDYNSKGDNLPFFEVHASVNGSPATICKYKKTSKSHTKSEVLPKYNVAYISPGEDFYSECVRRFSNTIMASKKQELLNILHSFDAGIVDVFLDADGDIYIHNAENAILPLFAYGSGMQKAFLLATIMISSIAQVLLIDEIDTTLNISALRELMPWFVKVCRERGIQSFVTTHNAEAIDIILDTIENDQQNDIRVITVRKTCEGSSCKVLTGLDAYNYRRDFEMELRI